MSTYDVRCPICGTMNNKLNLEETDGWMECESCQTAVQVFNSRLTEHIPIFTMEKVTRLFSSR